MIILVLGLALIGVLLYLVQQLPMDPMILTVIRVVVIVAVVYYLLRLFGLVDLPVPRVH